ncbi:hypothetical protein NFI96_030078 [Prochilodus magdalenae]|nr:hypothetical protein NFI96_030078 [Prochilodus magdalenae]
MADQQVKEGGDITLCCVANTDKVKAKWEINSQSLQCVTDKHVKKQNDTTFTLKIKNAEKEDEGKYTVTLENESGSVSCSAMLTVELRDWRTVEWNSEPIITPLKNFNISNGNVTELRFLLHGPVGAGKSSIINTIKTIFEGHQFINCLAASDLTGESFTKKYQKFSAGSLPFAFYDVMGLEVDEKEGKSFILHLSYTPSFKDSARPPRANQSQDLIPSTTLREKKPQKGVHQDDIIKALKGHIPNDYEFRPEVSISDDNRYYISNPTLNDQIHCLISVIAADKVTIMNDVVIEKMKNIRTEASKLGIPQLVFMTRVDQACPMTQKDLTKIYRSKKIKEKMQECSNRLGVPMNCVFPVMNYHEKIKMDEKLNCLMLEALTQAVHSAHDYVKKSSVTEQ